MNTSRPLPVATRDLSKILIVQSISKALDNQGYSSILRAMSSICLTTQFLPFIPTKKEPTYNTKVL